MIVDKNDANKTQSDESIHQCDENVGHVNGLEWKHYSKLRTEVESNLNHVRTDEHRQNSFQWYHILQVLSQCNHEGNNFGFERIFNVFILFFIFLVLFVRDLWNVTVGHLWFVIFLEFESATDQCNDQFYRDYDKNIHEVLLEDHWLNCEKKVSLLFIDFEHFRVGVICVIWVNDIFFFRQNAKREKIS